MIEQSELPTKRAIKWYGRRADLPDPRDVLFEFEKPHLMALAIPERMDMRAQMPPVWDQMTLGSCVGNAVGAAYAHMHHRQGHITYRPSRLFIYYGAREIEGSTMSDAGCEIRDGIKVVANLGAPHESIWPYKISRFAKKPTPRTYLDAVKHEALRYARIDNNGSTAQMLAALAAGFPIIIGITVAASFESKAVTDTGIVPMPGANEQILGGHCMLAVGYEPDPMDPRDVRFIVRNSWSADWGDAGYCYMPASYLIDLNLAGDFWIISGVA